MAFKENVEAFAIKQALSYMDKDPERNLPKLLDWFDKFDRKNTLKTQRDIIRQVVMDKDNNWHQLVMSLWTDIDSGVRNRLFENLIINGCLLGYQRQKENKAKYNCNVPWAILLDPTSACNLKCTGCWAAEYGNHMNLSYEEMDQIVTQGVELGTYVYLFTGGEPLVRKKDIIRLCDAHPDCVFSTFTNGTLIDKAFAEEMLRVQNFVPAISIEGFEEATDSRRGEGTYQKIVRAMNILKEKKLPFGISCCYTSANAEVIGSEVYFDQMIDMGAKFAWFFTYMPIGKGAVKELLATAEQREMMYHKIREYRQTKPLFTVDFWNDGEYVGGCIAGGRCYCHINANGDIEPCAFIHYSDSNIREKTLLEAYQSPLFMGYHDNQPWNENMLRPCPVLDNPGKLMELVEKSQAKSTDYQNLETAKEFSDKCVEVAEKWEPVADKLWAESHSGCASCGRCKREEDLTMSQKQNNTLYLLTGAAGFLGSHICEELVDSGKRVRALVLKGDKSAEYIPAGVEIVEGDLCDMDSLNYFFHVEDDTETVCIHCASMVTVNPNFNQKLMDINVGGTENIIAQCLNHPECKKLVYVGSTGALEELPKGEIAREADHFNPESDKVVGWYSKSKAMASQKVLDAVHEKGLNACIVQPSGILGPKDYAIGEITGTVLKIMAGEMTTGMDGSFNLCDVRDLAHGCVMAVEHGKKGECYILGNEEVTLRQLCEMLTKECGCEGPSYYLPIEQAYQIAEKLEEKAKLTGEMPMMTTFSVYNLARNNTYDYSKAAKELDYHTRPYEETIHDMVQWLKEQHLIHAA